MTLSRGISRRKLIMLFMQVNPTPNPQPPPNHPSVHATIYTLQLDHICMTDDNTLIYCNVRLSSGYVPVCLEPSRDHLFPIHEHIWLTIINYLLFFCLLILNIFLDSFFFGWFHYDHDYTCNYHYYYYYYYYYYPGTVPVYLGPAEDFRLMLPDPMAAIFVHDFNYNATQLAGSSPFCCRLSYCYYIYLWSLRLYVCPWF